MRERLAAFAILGWQSESFQLEAILAGISGQSPLVINATALLLVLGATARSALPPFSGWLLSSMTAPTPISALMHAGLVNAGGFLLIRFAPLLEAAPAARTAAVVIGFCGAVYGIGIMIVRPDVKRALAGSTVSQIGFMVMSCGLGAYAAALWHIIAHGLFKAWLFLGSGSAIGMKSGNRATILSSWAPLIIAIGTIGAALCILTFSGGDASLVPLLLGLATAVSMLVNSLGRKAAMKAKLTLLLNMAALIMLYSGGLVVAQMAIGEDAAPLVPNWVPLALLMVFLGTWVWQERRISNGRALPLPLYVRLINAGTLSAVVRGEQK